MSCQAPVPLVPYMYIRPTSCAHPGIEKSAVLLGKLCLNCPMLTTSLKEVTKICPRQVQFQSYLSQGQTGVTGNLFIKPCSSTKNSTKILKRKATNLCCGNGSIIHKISLLSSGETPTFVHSRTLLKAYIKYGPAIPTVALRV